MRIFPIIGFLSLLSTCGVLLVAFLRSQRIARDLATQLTHAREQQHQDKIQLSERSQLDTLKDEFISTVSHELRTPLTSIRGALGLLSSGVIGDVDAKALNLLRIAVTNLLSNAIKFSPPASTVRIHTDATSDSILLKVVDEGRGIPTDKLDTIFDRFQQVEPSDARQKGGTGLGLAICRSIVQQHSGSIWAQRNLGVGTTLYVMLPRTARSTDITAPAALPAALVARGEGAILVCDDDAGIRTVVSEHLTRQGYTVIEANSGDQALVLAAEHQVEAILLDLYMPGLSGWETLQRLRNNPLTANIPVVVLSVLSSTLRPQ